MKDHSAHSSTLTERAFAVLKAEILACRLEPGAVVSANDLGAEYGLGLAAVRAALERLVMDGWVRAMPQRGFRIAPITVQEVNELYAVAELVSPRLARLSCGLIGDCVEELRTLNEISNPYLPPANADEEHRVRHAGDEILHRIRERSGNRFALQITQQISERISRIIEARRRLNKVTYDARRDFGPLIDALERNDPNAAEAASLASMQRSKTRILNEILSIPEISVTTIHTPGPLLRRRGS